MGHNIFVSYKYKDSSIQQTWFHNYGPFTIVRDYVDELEKLIKNSSDQTYYGERGDDDLSDKDDEYIWNHLKNKIFYTSCTVVMISPNMRDRGKYDKSQWIPWEIYYSLRVTSRKDATSHRNGILGVVLPDRNGSYDYAISENSCCNNRCTNYNTSDMFTIIKENMFNIKQPNTYQCATGQKIFRGSHSYIYMVRWDNFINNIDIYIQIAEEIRKNADNYDLHIDVNQ